MQRLRLRQRICRRRRSLMRPVRTWARSWCACWVSQLSALPPKTLDNRTAISGEIPRFPFTSSDSVVHVTPSAAAASVMVRPKGSMHWRSTKPPGCGGFFIGMVQISLSGNRDENSARSEKNRRRNVESFAQFLDVGFVEVTLLVQNFGHDAFGAKDWHQIFLAEIIGIHQRAENFNGRSIRNGMMLFFVCFD